MNAMTNNDTRIVQLETALMIIKAVHSDICNDITMSRENPCAQATLDMILTCIKDIEILKKQTNQP